MPFHYSPQTPLKFLNEIEAQNLSNKKVGVIFFSQVSNDYSYTAVEVLSKSRNFREAAANMFSVLHKLDSMNLDLILVESVPEEGLGLAMMDRLKKATANFA